MGLETLAFVALTAISAASKMNAASSQADTLRTNTERAGNALRQQGELDAKERAKKVRYDTARLTSSFLTSGITLEGTPEDVLNETYQTGIDDIKQIGSNYNVQIKNLVSSSNAQGKGIVSSARSQAISDIAGSFGGAQLGSSAGSMFDTAGSYLPEDFAYGLNDAGFGNDAYDMLSMKDARG